MMAAHWLINKIVWMSRRVPISVAGVASIMIVLGQFAVPTMLGGLRSTNVGGYFWHQGQYAGWLMEKRSVWATDVVVYTFLRVNDLEHTAIERRPPQLGRLAEFKGGQDGVALGYRLVTFGLPLRMVMAEVIVASEPTLDDAGVRRYDYEIIGGTDTQQIQLRYPDTSGCIPVVPTEVMWVPLLGNVVFWWIVCAGAMVAMSAMCRAVRGSYWARDGRCHSCGYPITDDTLYCPECGSE